MKFTRNSKAVTPKAPEQRELVPILDRTGKTAMFDKNTGEILKTLEPKEKTTLYHPFTKERADAFASLIAQGFSQKRACGALGISEASVANWRNQSPDFCTLLEHAKSNRAEFIHEKQYEDSVTYLQSVKPQDLDEEGMKEFEQHLKLIQKKTKLLSEFKKQDAPHKFGGKSEVAVNNLSLTHLAFNAKISPELETMVRSNFMPKISNEGIIDLDNTSKDLDKFEERGA